MADGNSLPHDRGHLLWTADDGPSRMLLSSMDRWISTILADDGIEIPFMGGVNDSNAVIIAKGSGIIGGTSRIAPLIQIWAPSVQINWFAKDGINLYLITIELQYRQHLEKYLNHEYCSDYY